MKKSNIIAVIFIIVAIGINSFTAIAVASIFHKGDSYISVPEPPSTDIPYIKAITKSGGYYNISLAISNVTCAQEFQNVLINPNREEEKTDPIFYVNGTFAGTYPLTRLERGDSLQVSLMLPCSEYASGSTVYLCIVGNCFGCGKTVLLP